LIPEEWGGQTIYVATSAKKGTGIDQLLEMTALQSEILELKANPNRAARGVIIESRLDRGRGPVATVLIQNGTLKAGDAVVVGAGEELAVALERLSTEEVRLKEMHRSVGAINESDVMLASASNAIVIGFNVKPETKAATQAQVNGVDIRSYNVIYDAINDLRA